METMSHSAYNKGLLLNSLVFMVSLICFLVLFLLIATCIKLNFYTTEVRQQFLKQLLELYPQSIIAQLPLFNVSFLTNCFFLVFVYPG